MHDVGDVLRASILCNVRVLVELVVAYNVLVFELGGCSNLLLQKLESALAKVGVVEVEDLECVLIALRVDTDLYLGGEA